MITADQLLAHAIGDYVLQSDWMASKKRTDPIACLVHAMVYTLCFIPFVWGSHSWASPLLVICGTHQLIDHFGLARYVVWAKNFLAPRWLVWMPTCKLAGCQLHQETRIRNLPWRSCQKTGYLPDAPDFLAVWLLIIADNVLHVVINGLALRFL